MGDCGPYVNYTPTVTFRNEQTLRRRLPSRPMTFLRPGISRLLGRALLLRCPHCGGRGLFETFFKLRPHCPSCGLRLERGEGDYFVGAYLFNLIAVELILFFCVCGFVYLTWPNPNWDMITYVTAFLMLSGCMLCYPFSKTTWLSPAKWQLKA